MHVVSFSCLHGELNDARCSYFAKIGSMLRETCNKLCRLITPFKQSYLCKHLRALQTYFTNHVGGLSNVLKRERELNVLYNARYFERILSETRWDARRFTAFNTCSDVHTFWNVIGWLCLSQCRERQGRGLRLCQAVEMTAFIARSFVSLRCTDPKNKHHCHCQRWHSLAPHEVA